MQRRIEREAGAPHGDPLLWFLKNLGERLDLLKQRFAALFHY